MAIPIIGSGDNAVLAEMYKRQQAAQAAQKQKYADIISKLKNLSPAEKLMSRVGFGAGAYHGYKRTGSVLWAFLWGMFGGAMPLFAGILMVGQGFAKKKGA